MPSNVKKNAMSRPLGVSAACLGILAVGSCGEQAPAPAVDPVVQSASFAPRPAEDGQLGSPAQGPDHEADLGSIVQTRFSNHDVTPSPACLAVAPTGEVFVGVDEMGSLGKQEGRGRVVRLVDEDGDGAADSHTIFATVNNPRGILPVGDQVFVLHTTFSEVTKAASGMALVVFEDLDRDGIADGTPKPLLQNISSAKFVADRGTDHATNGIRMGIDGWIYIAVGDFGFHDAVDASGKHMTQLGGGVLRVRPDGTETEVYTHGLRNIYDVAIDPYMNIFTRGNTNDGGGWNIRFIHHIQSAEYGYPVLFKHFTEEIAPALVDLGGGSGTGSYFLHDPRWPDGLNHVPLMADWGRSQLYIHRVTMDGASFTQAEEPFLGVTQITDVDMDASGRMYLAAWDNAGYSGSAERGFVSRATPSNWNFEAYAASTTVDMTELAKRLRSDSSVARLDASQELLTRPKAEAAALALGVATDKAAPLYVRVAGIFTYAQIEGAAAADELGKLTEDGSVREFAIRALGDRKANQDAVDTALLWRAMGDESERVRAAATVAIGRTLHNEGSMHMLLGVKVPASFVAPIGDVEGPHATPNSELLLPHLAVRSLVAQNATEEVIRVISAADMQAGQVPTLALWAARYLHDEQVVAALIAALPKAKGAGRVAVLESIARLFHKEADYDGSWWWNTRPDTHGPYYKTVAWAGTPAVEACLSKAWDEGDAAARAELRTLEAKHRLGMKKLQAEPTPEEVEQLTVDLEALANGKGEVGDAAIEDVMIALGKLAPDMDRGRALFASQGCVACHTLTSDEKLKGPYMGQVGSIMGAEQIAESILRPNASISQGFASVMLTMKDGSLKMGFVSEEAAGEVVLRDISGGATRVAAKDIEDRNELETSMMPAGLASSLSLQDFVSLVGFLAAQK